MKNKNFKIDQLIKRARSEIGLKNFETAKKIFNQIILINPNIAKVNNDLGSIYLNENNFSESIKYLKKALELDPKLSVAYLNLGIAYFQNRDLKNSEKNYLKSIKLDNKNIIAHFNLGNLYKDNNDLISAEKYFNLALELKPDLIPAYQNLFFIFDRSNQKEKQKEIIIRAKQNLGDHFIVNFFQGIYDFGQNKYNKVIKNFENITINKKNINLFIIKNQFLAKSYDSIGEYDKAFNCFTDTNKLIFENYKNLYTKENYIKIIKKRINFFSNFPLNNNNSNNKNNNDPIFLVGFPRSGTTLLDTILRTHNSIDVIEEKPIIDQFINELKKETSNDLSNLKNLDSKKVKRIRDIYFQKRNQYITIDKNKIYIDKLPLNFIYIGEIISIFPNAKFIFALRNSFDVVLSCFMQHFIPNDAMMNFTSLKDTALFYNLSMSLYKKYFEIYESNIYEIKYEDVVNNFENTIKNLFIFLNIEWSDQIKKFYETANKRGIIFTPSYNQIDKPIYNNSVNRWKNYEKNFHEIKTCLSKWTKYFKY